MPSKASPGRLEAFVASMPAEGFLPLDAFACALRYAYAFALLPPAETDRQAVALFAAWLRGVGRPPAPPVRDQPVRPGG